MKKFITKSKIIKILSLTLSIIILSNVFGTVSFASNNNFSLDDYTFDDLRNMSAAEKIELLDKFEREYMSNTQGHSLQDYSTQPMWDSGNHYIESNEFRTHELITLEAIIELEDYLNNYENGATSLFRDGTEALAISLNLSVSSALPDRFGSGSYVTAFAGHFYNPDTGKNFLGFRSPTAKTNTVSNYNKSYNALVAYQYLADHDNIDTLLETIGCMLHFIQDASEPHHSSNVVANPISDDPHGEFEEYTYNIIDNIISCSINHTHAVVQAYSSLSVEELVDLAATISHAHIDSVNNVNNKSEWYNVADICVDSATSFSAIILYKLLKSKHVI